jgi:hypothetical protein
MFGLGFGVTSNGVISVYIILIRGSNSFTSVLLDNGYAVVRHELSERCHHQRLVLPLFPAEFR